MALRMSFKISALSLALLTLSALMPVAATNSDAAKERRWAEQVIDGLLDGDEAWLIDNSGHEFLSIFTRSAIWLSALSTRSNIVVEPSHALRNWTAVIWAFCISLVLSFGYAENVNTT